MRVYLSILLAASAYAAEITGVVNDPSAAPIPNARIECGGRIAKTTGDGAVRMAARSRGTAQITAVDVQPATVDVEDGAASSVTLELPAIAERLLVVGGRSEVLAEQAPAAAAVLTRADIERRQL